MALSNEKQRLMALLQECCEAGASEGARLAAGEAIFREFPPEEYSDDLADILQETSVSDDVKRLVLKILFVVGDEEAVGGISAFIASCERPNDLQTTAVMLLVRLDIEAAEDVVKSRAPWLAPLVTNEADKPSGIDPNFVLEGETDLADPQEEPRADRARIIRMAVEKILLRIGE